MAKRYHSRAIAAIPQQFGLTSQFGKPKHLSSAKFIGTAVVSTTDKSRQLNVDLYESPDDLGHGTTAVVAVIPYGQSWVIYYRKQFNLNCSVAFDILELEDVESARFCQEWIG